MMKNLIPALLLVFVATPDGLWAQSSTYTPEVFKESVTEPTVPARNKPELVKSAVKKKKRRKAISHTVQLKAPVSPPTAKVQKTKAVVVSVPETLRPPPVKNSPTPSETNTMLQSSELNEEIQSKGSLWGGEINYRAATDFNERTKPRAYQHEIEAALSRRLLPSASVYLSVSGAYSGYENGEILLDRDTEQGFLSDVVLGYARPVELGSDVVLDFDLSNTFPTTPWTKQEGINSVTTLAASGSYELLNRLSFIGKSAGSYIWNTYESSPVSLRLNKQASGELGAGFKVNLGAGFSLQLVGGVRLSHYLDGTEDINYQNSVGLGFIRGAFRAGLNYTNGSYADQENIDLFLTDEYRRLASLTFSYQF